MFHSLSFNFQIKLSEKMADSAGGNQGSAKESKLKQCCHIGYLKTIEGIFKLLEFIVVLLGLIIMASAGTAAHQVGPIEFFIFVHTTAWVFITLHIVLRLLNILHRFPAVLYNHMLYMILSGIAVLSFLICSSIVLGRFKGWSKADASGALGLIAMFLFGIECIYHFMKWRRGDSPSDSKTTQETSKKDDLAEQSPGY